MCRNSSYARMFLSPGSPGEVDKTQTSIDIDVRSTAADLLGPCAPWGPRGPRGPRGPGSFILHPFSMICGEMPEEEKRT